MRRAEGGAKNFGVFRVRNHDFTLKNQIFFQWRREARKCLGYFVWKITILRQEIIFFPFQGGAPPPLHTGSGFQWYRTYKRGYEASGSPLRFMLRRSSLVECVSVLHGTCLQSVENVLIRQYVHPCLSKKYTFYTIKSSLTFAY